jgi:hypothetical protein
MVRLEEEPVEMMLRVLMHMMEEEEEGVWESLFLKKAPVWGV